MSIAAILPLGFIIGMGHALETDHLAAVSNMLAEKGNRRALIARGAFWGLGHTLALFLICTAVVLLGLTISGTLQASVEFTVGVMIVALGVQTLWRLHRDRIHIHVHDHGAAAHLHAHSHKGETRPHTRAAHAHPHRARNVKALGIGLIHGAAGSGALLVLTISATQTVAGALAYFAVFGIGAMGGMAALSAIASYPLMFAQRGATWLRTGTTLTIGSAALLIGGAIMIENGALLHALNN
jgi:high-affinity nickel permease